MEISQSQSKYLSVLCFQRNELKEDFKEKYLMRNKVKEWVVLTKLVHVFFNHKKSFDFYRDRRNY